MIKKLFAFFLLVSSLTGYSQEVKSIEDIYPVYKGCSSKKTSREIKDCTSKKIRNFFKMSFDTELADRLFPQSKEASVHVEFVVNKKGEVENINAKANKREMAVEAIKVIRRMPKLKKPAYSNGKPIDIHLSFLMTIYF